jgi:hypothetical protein
MARLRQIKIATQRITTLTKRAVQIQTTRQVETVSQAAAKVAGAARTAAAAVQAKAMTVANQAAAAAVQAKAMTVANQAARLVPALPSLPTAANPHRKKAKQHTSAYFAKYVALLFFISDISIS